LLVLAACSQRDVDVDERAATAHFSTETAPRRTASHGAPIELVAVSEDGRAAVSQDGTGGTRLWLALDGSREPIVAHVMPAAQLAIGRVDGKVVVAARDEVGGIELVRFTDEGDVMSRARIAPDPPMSAIAIAPQGVLALRGDGTLAIIDGAGETSVRLEPPAGARIQHVATRAGRTLAVIDGAAPQLRWIEGTAWGASIERGDLDGLSKPVLSADGRYLAAMRHFTTLVYDLERNLRATTIHARNPLGFVDDNTLVLHDDDKLVSTQLAPLEVKYRRTLDPDTQLAAGDGIVVGSGTAALALHRSDVKYLGYRIANVSRIRSGGDVVAIGVGTATLFVDDALAIDRDALGPAQRTLLEQVGGDLRFEPTTGLAVVFLGGGWYLAKWNAERRAFVAWYGLAGEGADPYVVDPAQTDGAVAMQLELVDGQLHVREVAAAQLAIGRTIVPHRSYRVPGYLGSILRDGTAYTFGAGAIVVSKRGQVRVRIAEPDAEQVAPHPSGAYIAVRGGQAIALYDAAGTLRWRIPAPLARQVAWLGDDLVVDYGAGLGKIDAASGALIQRVCGWSFGLGALPDSEPNQDSICDAP
jgi:hypothetical protein